MLSLKRAIRVGELLAGDDAAYYNRPGVLSPTTQKSVDKNVEAETEGVAGRVRSVICTEGEQFES